MMIDYRRREAGHQQRGKLNELHEKLWAVCTTVDRHREVARHNPHVAALIADLEHAVGIPGGDRQ